MAQQGDNNLPLQAEGAKERPRGRSRRGALRLYWALLPSVVWDYNQGNNDSDGDIEELRFQLPVTRGNPFEYRLRVIPGLHYSQISQESKFIERAKNDDLTAVTARTELGFRLAGSKAWLLTLGYRLLYDFNTGDHDKSYRDLWSGELSWWFTKNVGLSFEFQQGTQPITLKEVDTINLGLKLLL